MKSGHETAVEDASQLIPETLLTATGQGPRSYTGSGPRASDVEETQRPDDRTQQGEKRGRG